MPPFVSYGPASQSPALRQHGAALFVMSRVGSDFDTVVALPARFVLKPQSWPGLMSLLSTEEIFRRVVQIGKAPETIMRR